MKKKIPIFKNYNREYERVFSGDITRKKCKLENVSTYNNIPPTVAEYIRLFHDEMREFQMDLFDHLVKYIWLRKRFCYCGKHRNKPRDNGYVPDKAFGIFVRHFVGVDHRSMWGGRHSTWMRAISYVDDFFPNLLNDNPFINKHEFPYENLSLDCLSIVYKMSERLKLLDYANARKMSYTEFLDYVLNYISCYNDEYGMKYEFIFINTSLPYIKVLK